MGLAWGVHLFFPATRPITAAPSFARIRCYRGPAFIIASAPLISSLMRKALNLRIGPCIHPRVCPHIHPRIYPHTNIGTPAARATLDVLPHATHNIQT
jgi:hypothetical protein